MRSHITSWTHAHAPEIGWLVIATAFLSLWVPYVGLPMYLLAVMAAFSIPKE